LAQQAADRLATTLPAHSNVLASVSQPNGSKFFQRNALLFLPPASASTILAACSTDSCIALSTSTTRPANSAAVDSRVGSGIEHFPIAKKSNLFVDQLLTSRYIVWAATTSVVSSRN
jgi:hypothetical protein